jgi:hypothetical protein
VSECEENVSLFEGNEEKKERERLRNDYDWKK